jgi:hypothetical protein
MARAACSAVGPGVRAMIPLGSHEGACLADWLGPSFALAFGAEICAIRGARRA